MKRIGIVLTTLALAASAFGQGAIQFQNRSTSLGIFAPIYGVNPGAPGVQLTGNSTTNGGAVNYGASPLLTGTGWTAALYGDGSATDPNTFQLLSTATFNTATTLLGIIRGPTTAPLVPWVPGPANGTGNFEIRVWDSSTGVTTWAGVLANPNIARGRSATLLNVPVIAAPNTPTGLTGLTSFGLFVPVPEPSLIALGALGLGALLLRRRKA